MNKRIVIIVSILISILILIAICIDVSAVGHSFPIQYFTFFDCYDANYQPVTVDKVWYRSGEAGIVCGPVDSQCYFMTRNTTQGDVPMIRFAVAYPPTYGEQGQYLLFNFSGRLYFNCNTPSDLHFIFVDDKGHHDIKLGDYFAVYHQAEGVQTCYFFDANFTVPFYGHIQAARFELSIASSDFVAFNITDGYLDVVPDPNGAQTEANSMISGINSVITGSVNTAPLTSGVGNIVGNVTSMMPDTTDIPYVSDAIGSLTQLTNIAASEIGAFFDPFFTADMTVNIAGVSFNPFLTFLIIGVVISLVTFAIKIFTRGDNER